MVKPQTAGKPLLIGEVARRAGEVARRAGEVARRAGEVEPLSHLR